MNLTCGTDLVCISDFAGQLAAPGSTFRRVFSDREWEYCRQQPARLGPRAGEESAAGRWAAKEAVVKVWSAQMTAAARGYILAGKWALAAFILRLAWGGLHRRGPSL